MDDDNSPSTFLEILTYCRKDLMIPFPYWKGEHVMTNTFINTTNCDLKDEFLLRVQRSVRFELGEWSPWKMLTVAGIPYSLNILGIDYMYDDPKKPNEPSLQTHFLKYPNDEEERQRAPPIHGVRKGPSVTTLMNVHFEFKILKTTPIDNTLLPRSTKTTVI
jgi:hypothetical protein